MSPLTVWTVIVFVPLALGVVLRALLRRWRRAWWLSAVLALLTILAWIVTLHPPNFGQRTLRPADHSGTVHDRGVRHHRTHPSPAPGELICPFANKNPEVHGTSEFFLIHPGG